MRKKINTRIPENKYNGNNNNNNKRRSKINKRSIMADGGYILEELYNV